MARNFTSKLKAPFILALILQMSCLFLWFYVHVMRQEPRDPWEDYQALLHLKVALTSELVLKGPKYDSTPFIITTDGCKFGFRGYVHKGLRQLCLTEQRKQQSTLLDSRQREYQQQRRSTNHSSLNSACWKKHTIIAARQPPQYNPKLNACTLAGCSPRFLAHNIIDAHHRPGDLNVVADRLSH